MNELHKIVYTIAERIDIIFILYFIVICCCYLGYEIHCLRKINKFNQNTNTKNHNEKQLFFTLKIKKSNLNIECSKR